MKRAIVVGSGAGGATVAKELQGRFDVTVLEAGGAFRPSAMGLPAIEKLRKAGLLFDEREMSLAFPTVQVRKTRDLVLINGMGLGGSTTICTGNGLRMDQDLRALGIDLDAEFQEIYREIPISTAHQKRWRKQTRRLFDICREMDLEPQPMPKMGEYDKCVGCGRCVLGCTHGAKWDSRRFLQVAIDRGARVVTNCRVERVVIEDGRVTGVEAKKGLARRFYPADLVVLAAGGFATPVILQNSHIACESRLFVDPVLCVAAEYKDAGQHREVEMPFVIQQPHYILSPYFDYLSFLFNKSWRHPARDILGIMIKLADTPTGTISQRSVGKALTDQDKERLNDGVEICREILRRFTGTEDHIFLGTVNAGHPGGMLPLTAQEAESFHHSRLPSNLYVADATLLPQSLGNPPILTIIALAKRVSRMCANVAA